MVAGAELDAPAAAIPVRRFDRSGLDDHARGPKPAGQPRVESDAVDVPGATLRVPRERGPREFGTLPRGRHRRARPGEVERHLMPQLFALENLTAFGRQDLRGLDSPWARPIDDHDTRAGCRQSQGGE
jgi:hypothetical protein